jgi:hypothetical protein
MKSETTAWPFHIAILERASAFANDRAERKADNAKQKDDIVMRSR